MTQERSFRVEICRDINLISSSTWNSVVEAAFGSSFYSYEWLKAYQETAPHQSQAYHLLAYCESQLVGILPLFLTRACPRLTAHRKYLVENEPDLAEPFLLGHTFYSYYGGPLFSSTDPELLSFMMDAFENLAHNLGVDVFGLVNVPENNTPLVDHLRSKQYAVRYISSSMFLPIEWSSFDEYLHNLPKIRRRNIVRADQKARECGLTFEWVDQPTDYDELEVLNKKTLIKYRHVEVNLYPPTYLKAIKEAMQQKFKLLLVKDSQGNLVRYSLILDFNKCLQPWIAGIDYETINKYEHSRFLYNILIRHAIEEGYREIDMGRGAYRFKERYGFLRRVLFLALKSGSSEKVLEVDRWSRELEISSLKRYNSQFSEIKDHSK